LAVAAVDAAVAFPHEDMTAATARRRSSLLTPIQTRIVVAPCNPDRKVAA